MNLTQDELAERLKISRTTVTMWETGEAMPRADKLPELAKILGCTIDDLFKSEEKGA
jgi:transcriptional regulator with XRE-family HTH domain